MKEAYKKKCSRCKEEQTLMIDPADIKRWQQGELIQRAMPYLNANQREILISGICGPCVDKMLGPEE